MTDRGVFDDFAFVQEALSTLAEDFYCILLAFAINLACTNTFVAFHWH
jgi:hypothetical protein